MAAHRRPFRLGFLIHDVSRLRRTVLDKALRPLAVTRSQWSVLKSLERHGVGGLTQIELSRAMEIGSVALVGLLDRLEARGYLQRRSELGDRRTKRVLLTAQGIGLLGRIGKIAEVVDAEIMGRIPDVEADGAEAVLQQMKQHLILMDAVPRRSDPRLRPTLSAARRSPPAEACASGAGAQRSGSRYPLP
jgi:MarR family transcriptional regulator, transcriptional regulator for hemolysin